MDWWATFRVNGFEGGMLLLGTVVAVYVGFLIWQDWRNRR